MNHSDKALSLETGLRRVFVTGGSGFVGRNIVKHYLNAGVEVLALARSHEAGEHLIALGATPVMGDLCTPDWLSSLKGCDLLIHAAADTSHGYASRKQWQINAEGTATLFSAARDAGVKRAVHISTESVLLAGKPMVMADETCPFPRNFAGSYSRTKAEAEINALQQANDRFSVVVVRPRFVWGAGDTTALPQLVAAVNSKKFAWISGGNYLSSTTHINNLCHGVALAAEFGRNKEVYFISDGQPQLFRDFVSRLLATQGITSPENTVPRWLISSLAWLGNFVYSVSGGRMQSPLNRQVYATSAVEVTFVIDKAKKQLGYTPVKSIEQGMLELMRKSLLAENK